ncbi:MAG: hypothetical protein F6K26_53745 [Moorea sp. SIO2I5]|nr:hypothetical protein [Moorena sp. SIO2I5]
MLVCQHKSLKKKDQENRAAGQSVLKAQRLRSNSWTGWEAYTELEESV